jgi:hypothetical protein
MHILTKGLNEDRGALRAEYMAKEVVIVIMVMVQSSGAGAAPLAWL